MFRATNGRLSQHSCYLQATEFPEMDTGVVWILKIARKMFQNSEPLTERPAGTTNGAASARKLLPTRTSESRVEIEASSCFSPLREGDAATPLRKPETPTHHSIRFSPLREGDAATTWQG